jgi:IS5 family transposase
MAQPSFFDTENRLKKLNEKDNLLRLNQLVDWNVFRPTIEAARRTSTRKSNAGRKPYDALVMFKCLVLQQLYNLSDEEFEFQLRDRLTFIRFVGLNPEDTTPDANTLWDFRELLTKQNELSNLFNRFNQYLDNKGLRARKGQIVDASFVEAPRQRNTREQNQTIKDGLIPAEFLDNPHVASQKDTEARWTQKNDEDHFGYKNHISVDVEHKLIRNFACTNAAVHDSNQFETLLASNSSRDVWADSAYRSEEKEAILDAMNYRSQVHEKGNRSAALTEAQIARNKQKSKIRARVEHVFGYQSNSMRGGFLRVIGIARATTKIALTNLVYNIMRFCYLHGKVLSKN